jgi:hypothetical protein
VIGWTERAYNLIQGKTHYHSTEYVEAKPDKNVDKRVPMNAKIG